METISKLKLQLFFTAEAFIKIFFSNINTFHVLASDVEQMAIDWLTKNFYFVDDVDDRVFVCNKDGQTCVTLLDQELYNPKGIALDPTMGSVSRFRVADLTLPLKPHSTSLMEKFSLVIIVLTEQAA